MVVVLAASMETIAFGIIQEVDTTVLTVIDIPLKIKFIMHRWEIYGLGGRVKMVK